MTTTTDSQTTLGGTTAATCRFPFAVVSAGDGMESGSTFAGRLVH